MCWLLWRALALVKDSPEICKRCTAQNRADTCKMAQRRRIFSLLDGPRSGEVTIDCCNRCRFVHHRTLEMRCFGFERGAFRDVSEGRDLPQSYRRVLRVTKTQLEPARGSLSTSPLQRLNGWAPSAGGAMWHLDRRHPPRPDYHLIGALLATEAAHRVRQHTAAAAESRAASSSAGCCLNISSPRFPGRAVRPVGVCR